jgi:molybdopterin-guanine dinucleotide biosynthesis protein A
VNPSDRVPVLGILAGGASQRFPAPGGKLAADLGGAPLLHSLLRRLRPAGTRIVLAGRPPPGCPVPEGLEVLEDPADVSGPLAGLLALARNAPEGFVVTPGDMPFLPPRLPIALWNASQGGAGACLRGRDPLPLALRPAGYEVLERLALEGRGPRHLLATLAEDAPGIRELPPPPPEELADVDTAEDLRVAREQLERRRCGPVGEADEPVASSASSPLLRWDS